jgi:hypothetical protein
MRGPGSKTATAIAASLLTAAAAFSPVLAQEGQSPCCAQFDYVLERTIFKVDAVRLELTLLDETSDRVAELVTGQSDPQTSSDSVAALYLGARQAYVRMTFLRSFGLDRFLDANRDVMQKMVKSGYLTEEEFRRLDGENRERFAVLKEDGVQDGDRLEHEVRGDTVTTLYTDISGAVRIDQVRIGHAERRVLMGSLFGPQSGFRKGLLDQVYDRVQAR